jgi:hypothetical protein
VAARVQEIEDNGMRFGMIEGWNNCDNTYITFVHRKPVTPSPIHLFPPPLTNIHSKQTQTHVSPKHGNSDMI